MNFRKNKTLHQQKTQREKERESFTEFVLELRKSLLTVTKNTILLLFGWLYEVYCVH